MRNKQSGDGSGFFAIVSVIIIVIGVYVFDSMSCKARWRQSGMQTSWGPVQGCLVKVGERWVPDDRVRETDLPKAEEKK